MTEMIERVASAILKASPRISGGYVDYEALARAAIEAMRDPPEAMWLSDGLYDHMHPTDAWEIMIDAALGRVTA